MAKALLKGRYSLLAEIGRGERTVTYKAQDKELDRTVVVKVLQEQHAAERESRDRFHRAAQAVAGLSHPNVVGVYDMGSDAGVHYIVTEYVEGQSLDELLASKAPLNVEQSLDVAISICAALAAAHRAGLVHGQLTPRNILLTDDQQAKVSDFGVVDTPPPVPAGEEAPARYGALYLSPEQAMGRRVLPASDVYAVGVVLYQMLSGAPPFQAESYAALAEKHIREEPKPLDVANPAVPQALSAVVHKALAKTSADRYRTATELRTALLDYRRRSAETEVAARVRAEERRLARDRLQIEETKAQRSRLAEERRLEPAVVPRRGPDWVAIVLGMIATLAVLGLVPLWLMVFLRYFA